MDKCKFEQVPGQHSWRCIKCGKRYKTVFRKYVSVRKNFTPRTVFESIEDMQKSFVKYNKCTVTDAEFNFKKLLG